MVISRNYNKDPNTSTKMKGLDPVEVMMMVMKLVRLFTEE